MTLQLRVEKAQYVVEYKEKLNKDGKSRTGKVLARFGCSPITPSENKILIEKNTIKEWDAPDKVTKKELRKEIDYLGITYDRIDKIIQWWEGIEITNTKGEVIDDNPECNRKNKLAVFEMNADVINWVVSEAEEIFKLNRVLEKEQEKNLKAGPSGSAKKTQQTARDAD